MKLLARSGFGIALLLWMSLSSASARAQGRVRLQALVASASTDGRQIDPPLAHMARDFGRNGLAFTSYKLLSQTSLEVAPGQTGSVRLPTGQATITYLRQEPGGKLRVRVTAPGSSSEYDMGPGSEVYIDAGPHGKGKLFLLVRR